MFKYHITQRYHHSMSDFWYQLSRDNARAHSAQWMETLSHLNKQLSAQIAQRDWQQDGARIYALLQQNAGARWLLTLSLCCFTLCLLLRTWRLLCKIVK